MSTRKVNVALTVAQIDALIEAAGEFEFLREPEDDPHREQPDRRLVPTMVRARRALMDARGPARLPMSPEHPGNR